VLGLERRDFEGDVIRVRGNAHEGVFTPGDQPTKRHVHSPPCPPSTAELIWSVPARIDTPLLFPTPTGRLWRERNFYRDVWHPTRERAELDCTPHDFRHAWVTPLRAAGIDPADLADMGGHSLETATSHYTHALPAVPRRIRQVIG